MGRYIQVTRAFGFAACLALGGGCLHVHRDANGNWKSIDVKLPEAKPAESTVATGSSANTLPIDAAVKQAGAIVPSASAGASLSSLAKLAGKSDPSKGAVTDYAIAWQNKIAYQPDVANNGEMMAGLVGQLFMFAPGLQFAPVQGKLIIEMFEDSPRAGATGEGTRIGGWTLDKDAIRKGVMIDEKFGKCYVMMLPWPGYNGNITRVKLKTRYEPEQGYPIFKESKLTLDANASDSVVLPAGGFPSTGGGLSGMSPQAGGGFMGSMPAVTPPAARTAPPLDPLPIGVRTPNIAPNPTSLPADLPPLVITAQGR